MARMPRIVVPGQALHIIQRGNNRQDVFFVADDHLAGQAPFAGHVVNRQLVDLLLCQLAQFLENGAFLLGQVIAHAVFAVDAGHTDHAMTAFAVLAVEMDRYLVLLGESGREHDVLDLDAELSRLVGELVEVGSHSLEHLVRVVHVVHDLDAGLGLELLQHLVGDVVAPVVDMQHRLFSGCDVDAADDGQQEANQGMP